MTEAIARFYCLDHQVLTYNMISETLSKCLEGKSFNNMVDFVRDKQTMLGQKKLGQL